MIARRPRPLAAAANANISSGMRCADSTWVSCATPNSASTSTALLMVGQSLAEPITTATTGSVMSDSCSRSFAVDDGGVCAAWGHAIAYSLNLDPAGHEIVVQPFHRRGWYGE